MGRLEFSKMQGAGNDFVFIDAWNEEVSITAEQVRLLCDRHFGIGADGVIIVRRSADEGKAGFMDYLNADGSIAQMCGNGVRCFAKYVLDNGYAHDDGTGIVVDTRAGDKIIKAQAGDDGLVATATVDMGVPLFDPADLPTTLEANALTETGIRFIKEVPLDSPWGTFTFTCLSMGNPHAVCFIDEWDSLDKALFPNEGKRTLEAMAINEIGSFFEAHPAFPERANIEFACVNDAGIRMRVYERGCAETMACGTGACATGVAAYLEGRATRENDLILNGGTLHIEYRTSDDHALMTGPAALSFTGEITV